jgi:hypothetical protein
VNVSILFFLNPLYETTVSNGKDYHVGMKGLDVTFTHKPGWTIKTEMLGVDDQGHTNLRVYTERVDN